MSDDVTKGLELAYALRDTTGLSKGTDAAEALRAHLQGMADKADRLALAYTDALESLRMAVDERDALEAAGAGVPAGWEETIQGAINELPYQHYLIPRLTQLLAAAPAAPQPSTTEESSAPEPAAPSEQQDADKLIAMGCAVDRSQAKRLLTQLRAAVNGSSAYEPAQPTELERQMREALEPFARLDLGARLGEIVHQEFGWDVLRARKAIAAFKAAHPAYAEDAQ